MRRALVHMAYGLEMLFDFGFALSRSDYVEGSVPR